MYMPRFPSNPQPSAAIDCYVIGGVIDVDCLSPGLTCGIEVALAAEPHFPSSEVVAT